MSELTQIEVRNRQRKWALDVPLIEEIGTRVAASLFKNIEEGTSGISFVKDEN